MSYDDDTVITLLIPLLNAFYSFEFPTFALSHMSEDDRATKAARAKALVILQNFTVLHKLLTALS